MSKQSQKKILIGLYRALLETSKKFDSRPAAKALITSRLADEHQYESKSKTENRDRNLFKHEITEVMSDSSSIQPYYMTPSALSNSFERQVKIAFRRPIRYYADILSCDEQDAFRKCVQVDFDALRLLQSRWKIAEIMGLASQSDIDCQSKRKIENVCPTVTPTTGSFLIAHPMMTDNCFKKSVILITDISESGINGFVVNKPISDRIVGGVELRPVHDDSISKSDTVASFHIENEDVYFGGPVPETLILHKYTPSDSKHFDNENKIHLFRPPLMDVNINYENENQSSTLKDKESSSRKSENIDDNSKKGYKMIVGVVSWFPGQLENEIKQGLWIAVSAPVHIAERAKLDLWKSMLVAMGGMYAEFAKFFPAEVPEDLT